jgi:tetratricopeptide (TPR) repeat protein
MGKKKLEITEEQNKVIDHLTAVARGLFITKAWKDEQQLAHMMKRHEIDIHNALTRWPDHPLFAFHAAVFYQHTERSGMAINLFKHAITSGLDNPAVFTNLAASYKNEHVDDLAEHWYMQAARAARDANDLHALAHSMHGVASLYINRGEPEKCIYWCNKALDINPTDRFALWNKGIACLEAGQWEEGGRLYHDAGFITSEWKAAERKLKTYGGLPEWDGTKGQTVICYGEQGVGDEVMFASILPDLMRDAKVIIDCDKRLERLFRDSFPEAVAVYPTSGIDDPFPWIEDHKVDARIAMGSLLHLYRKKAEDFPKVPFLKADPERRKKWRAILDAMGPGKHIALSYCGGMKKTRQDMRSINPEKIVDWLKIPGIHWHSVQYHDFAPDNAAELGRLTGVPIHHWHDMIKDWDEWAAFLSEVDLLITVNTSVHHLAGALGTPQWCLTPKYVAWRYGIAGPSPFYGNCSMIRQADDMSWEPVIKTVQHYLETSNGEILHPEIRVEPVGTYVAGRSGSVGEGSNKGAPVATRAIRKGSRGRGKRR